MPCVFERELPAFVTVGMATFVEKFTVVDGRVVWGARSNWRMPDGAARTGPRDLALELSTARDQSFLRSFFLFLYHRAWLVPFLDALRASDDDALVVLQRTTGKTLGDLGAAWMTWVNESSGALPVVTASSPAPGLSL